MSDKKNSGKVVQNRGQVTYTLRSGPDGEARAIRPGEAIETLDEKEAKHLLSYKDFHDAENAVPQHKARIENLEAEIERLKGENDRLAEAAKNPIRAGSSTSGHPAGNQEGTGFNVGPVTPPEGVSLEEASSFDEGEDEEATSSRKHKKGR